MPRCFKVLVAGLSVAADAKLHDIDRFTDEGHFVHFASFGVPGKAIRFNNTWIKPEDISLSSDRRVYTLTAANNDGSPVHMYFDFTQMEKPVGHIETVDGMHALALQPWAVSFNVSVAPDAGAYFSSGTNTLVWDDTTSNWKNASWEQNSMVFSYDTVTVDNPFGGSYVANEVAFQDSKSGTTSEYTSDVYGPEYTALFQPITVGGKDVNGCVIAIKAGYVTPAPAIRATDSVISVFPELAIFKFDELATSFTGAFTVPQSTGQLIVYSVIGTGILPDALTTAPGPVLQGGQLCSQPTANFQPDSGTCEKKSLFRTGVKPVPHPFALAATDTPSSLPLTGLINFDPMTPDANNATGYTDSVSQVANQDLNDIICYYMDSDIHTTFVSATPTTLDDSTVTAIATDSGDNQAFYKTLQVPYVTSNLGMSTLEEGKKCNVPRAQAQLKTLPANSPIYQRHSDALYRHRFMQKFPSVQNYLDDQAKTDYSVNIASGASYMKNQIIIHSAGVNGTNTQDTLDAALADIDSLAQWATSQKLYWAFNLYNWCEAYFLPNLITQSANGSLSASVSRTLKKLTLIFGVLENGQQNPSGKSFAEAFNDLIRLFQMSTIIPQFVDADSAAEDLDSIEKEMLQQFYTDNIGSADPNVIAEAQRALQLATNDYLRRSFFNSLAMSMRVGGSLGSWAAIEQLNEDFLDQASWYRGLANAAELAGTFMRVSCVALLVLPMLNQFGGGWSAMTPEQKTTWVITAAALTLTFFIKGLQGAKRLVNFWDDLAGLTQYMKAFLGFRSVLDNLGPAAEATENTFAQWFMRGNPETMEITGDEVTIGMQIFGRSAGEFLTNCVGAVLAGVNLVMSAIDLAKSTNPLQKDMDVMFIASSGLQLLALGANWLVSAAIVTSETAVSVLSTCAAVAGPLAIAFAVTGLIIMIVMMCLQKNPPNPVQDFVDQHAAKAGLKMDYNTAIDYFNVVPSDATASSLNGISFQATTTGTGGTSSVMQLGSQPDPNIVAYNINAGQSITYLPDTCWNVKTDSNGVTTIWTYYMDPTNGQMPVCLAEGNDGTLQALPPPSKTTTDANGNSVPVDPAVYAQQLSMQQWQFVTKSAATTTTRTDGNNTGTFVVSANFLASRGTKVLTLKEQSDGTNTVELITPEIPGLSNETPIWSLTLQSMSPSSFNYIQPNWILDTTQTDEQNVVVFEGPSSSPLSWSISPALPSFLILSSQDGTISQASGVTPTVMAATIYTVTATITILGKDYSKTSSVTILVTDTSAQPPSSASLLMSLDNDAAHTSGAATEGAGAVRSRFAASNHVISEPGSGAMPGQGAISIAPGLALQDTVGFSQIQRKFEAFASTAPSFFLWQQPATVPLNQHYTANAAIAKMQNSLSGNWHKATGMFSSQDVSFESIYFPNPMAAPPPGTNDPLDYHGAASAYVAQCIYNGDGYAQALWNTNTQRFIDWLQSPASTSTTQAHCSLDQYTKCIENPDWIAYKRATQANGGWSNQSYEMYFHFLKLTALGATTDQITSIYDTITGADSGLVAGNFSDITPSTWTQYTGYLFAGPISYSQVGVQSLNTENSYYLPGQGGIGGGFGTEVTQHADTSFIRQSGYWHDLPRGCCFTAGTEVLLADGKTSVAIEEINPGTKVLSPTREYPPVAKTVKLLSRPRRQGRALYSFRDEASGVSFTATHPIFLGYDQDDGIPILGFVDVEQALLVNPIWGAFHVERLVLENLIQKTSPVPLDGEEENNAVLYDLVFETATSQADSCGVTVFYITQPTSSNKLLVCSESPDIAVLPAMSRFILAFLEAMASRGDVVELFPDGLRSGALDYSQRIQKHRIKAASSVSATKIPLSQVVRFGKGVTLETAISVIGTEDEKSQPLMDASEAILTAFGMSLQSYLDDGWQFASPGPQDIEEPAKFCLSTHDLSIVQTSLLQVPDSLKGAMVNALRMLSKLLLTKPRFSVSISGGSSARIAASVDAQTPVKSLGSHLHRLHSMVTIANLEDSRFVTQWSKPYRLMLSFGDGDAIVVADGTVVPNVVAKWPLRIEQLTKVDSPDILKHWHVGWVSVTGAVVLGKALDAAQSWSQCDQSGLAKLDLYAERLGTEVGKDVIENLFGSSSA